MIKNRIETLLRPFLKSEEDKSKLFTVILPSFVVRSGYFLLAYLTQIALTRMLGPSRYGVFVYTIFMPILMAIAMVLYFSYTRAPSSSC